MVICYFVNIWNLNFTKMYKCNLTISMFWFDKYFVVIKSGSLFVLECGCVNPGQQAVAELTPNIYFCQEAQLFFFQYLMVFVQFWFVSLLLIVLQINQLQGDPISIIYSLPNHDWIKNFKMGCKSLTQCLFAVQSVCFYIGRSFPKYCHAGYHGRQGQISSLKPCELRII